MELDIHTNMIRKAVDEELCLLVRREAACMRQSGLERVQISFDIGRERQSCQVGEMVGAEGRPGPLLTKPSEILPCWSPGVPLEDGVPHLGLVGHVEGREPHPIDRPGLLASKELLALEQPSQRIVRPIIARERKLVVTRHR